LARSAREEGKEKNAPHEPTPNSNSQHACLGKMPYSIHDKTLVAKKARILINALIDCAKAGVKSSFVIKKMLWGISRYLECGSFTKENWRTYHRASDAAKQVRTSGDKDWKRNVTFEHVRLPVMVI
jgi:hypothetical protein